MAQARALRAKGRPVPAHFLPPDIDDGYAEWFSAFWELSTDRRIDGGPIPWSAIEAWPVPAHERGRFLRCIRAMDRAFLDAMQRKREQKRDSK